MLNAESKQLEELLKSFTNAEQRVRTVLLTTKAGDVEELKVKLDKKLDKISLSLTEKSKKWAEKDLPHAYDEGVQKINGKRDRTLHQSDNTILNSYIELSTRVQTATDHAKDVINNAIKEAESRGGYGATVGNVKDIIQETLYKENASMVVQYSNGVNMPLPAYAQMLARTSRIESSNTGSFDRCKQLGIDLVRCTTMPGCCPYCKKYEGKVYSISGKDTRFPALYETALQHGYNIMHPNCRHEFIPFVEAMQGESELKSIIKESNTFTNLSKDDIIFKKYNKDQATLRQWREELTEYTRLKEQYGDEMPYKTLGGFRRARRHYKEKYAGIPNKFKDFEKRTYIKSAKCVKTIHEGKQGKHILDHNNYKRGNSYISITPEECQDLVNKYSGAGKLEYKSNGAFNSKELITLDHDIGWVLDLDGKWVKTNKFKIHYSKDGTHIVPTLKGGKQ